MFFPADLTVVYLKERSLEIYDKKFPEPLVLGFPKDIVNNLEVLDQDKLEQVLITWATENKLGKKEASIVLSGSLTFTRPFPLESSEKLQPEINTFLEEIPFEPSKIEKLSIRSDKEMLLVVTNGDLYKSVKTVFERLEWRILAVSPLFLFGDFGQGEVLTKEELGYISQHKELFKKGDFLHNEGILEKGLVKEEVKKGNNFGWGYLLMLFSLVLFSITFIFGVYRGIIKLPGFPTTSSSPVNTQISPVPSINSQGSPSALLKITESTPSASKEELKIQVLNGSGVGGQAAEIEAMLLELGFSNIETGNSEEPRLEVTKVTFLPKVSEALRKQLVAELKKKFMEVSGEVGNLEEFDVVVITGKSLAKE